MTQKRDIFHTRFDNHHKYLYFSAERCEDTKCLYHPDKVLINY